MLACVSQGAAPLGREVTITAGEGNVINELAGRPALETVEQIISELSPRERTLVAGGLLIGIVIDGGKPDYQQGDFLVRGVLGADPESGSLAVSASVRPGQVLRLHARDAQSADEDFRRALRLHVEAMGDRPPAGAIVFSCNGRGSSMFGVRDHDAAAVQHELARRAGRGVLRCRRDRAGGRAKLPARVHVDRRGVPELREPSALETDQPPSAEYTAARDLSQRQRARDRGDRRHRPGDRPRARRTRSDGHRHRSPRRGARAAGERDLRPRDPCDLSRRDEVDRLVQAAGQIDVLVANAALPGAAELTDLTQEQIDEMLEVNLRAPIALARALVPPMVSRRRGHLVFISSLNGKAATPATSIYAAAKFGLRGFALSLREDLRPHGVGVSSVLPGFIRDAGMFADTKVELPRGVGTRSPEDVAAAVVKAIDQQSRRGRGRPARPAPRRDVRGSGAGAGGRGRAPPGQRRRSRSTWPRRSAAGTSRRKPGGRSQPRRRCTSARLAVVDRVATNRGVLTRDGRQRADDLVGQAGALGRALGRGLDPHDDVVAVDLLEQDGRRRSSRRSSPDRRGSPGSGSC